jgi:hypothetical protein
MERTKYFQNYYDTHKEKMNERRLYDYYIEKFSLDFVEDIKKKHDKEAISVLKKHSKLMIKLNKIQKRKEDLQKELVHLETIKSNL